MSNDHQIARLLYTHEQYLRFLNQVKSGMRTALVYMEPRLQQYRIRKVLMPYRWCASRTLDKVLTHVPSNLLDQLKPALRPRWQFVLLSWRWRICGKTEPESSYQNNSNNE